MKRNLFAVIFIGIVAFTLAACSNQENGPGTAEQQKASSPPAADYKTVFQTSVFLGDSITEGLSFHDVLDEHNVLAGAGKTTEFALEDVEELTKRKPAHIFIQLGSDDILWPTEEPQAYSIANYTTLIRLIKENIPQADITLLSVTPVTEEALSKEPRYDKIADYNQAVKALAEKERVGFVDLTPMFTSDFNLYDADGIHFQPDFYIQLLELLKEQVS